MYYLFLESEDGKLGYSGQEYFSKVEAEDKAQDYSGITHIIEARNLVGAKRKMRDIKVQKTGDVDHLYKNIKDRK